MKKIRNLKLFGLVAFLAFALVFIGIDFIEGQVKIQKKPDKPKPPGKDEIPFQDMPLCISFLAGEIEEHSDNYNSLCDSVRGVTAFAGRRWSISLEINKNTIDPSITLTLDPLVWVAGDPDAKNDGGYYNGRDDQDNPCPTPTLLDSGRIFEPQFAVGVGIDLDNIKDMDPGEFKEVEASLIFKDDYGDEYHLFWGPDLFPGSIRRTNESAPFVGVLRTDDGTGKRSWLVHTQAESARGHAHTAFLWKLSKPWTFDYCGAYDVLFSYTAIEE